MRWFLALLVVALPSIAGALSCLPPNAARSLDQAMQSGVPVRAVAGELRRTAASPETRTGTYHLKGTELSRGGWLSEFAEEIRVEARCVASWCAELPGAQTQGLFLLTIGQSGAPLLRIGPCGGTVFPLPDGVGREALQRCARTGRCSAEDIRLFEPR